MFALNFQSPHHEDLLRRRVKNCTVRLGDLRDIYAENSLVWITFGKKMCPRIKLYQAIIDKVVIKQFSQLTAEDLIHQNPNINTTEQLIKFFETLYCRSISSDDVVSVIYFSEVISE